MLNKIAIGTQNRNSRVSFTSQPIYKLKIPKLVDGIYELTPVLFSKLNPYDKLDLKLMEHIKEEFTFGHPFESIVDDFLSRNTYSHKINSFYCLEQSDVAEPKKKILGLTSLVWNYPLIKSRPLYVGKINARSDLQKKILSFTRRKYKNIGELLMYAIGKMANERNDEIYLYSANDKFYNKIKMPRTDDKSHRVFNGSQLKEFLKRCEKKFNLSDINMR